MAAKEVGYIESITGSATVVDSNGVVRVLNVGDKIFEGDRIVTGPVASVQVAFVKGNNVSLAGNNTLVIDDSVSFESGPYTDQQVAQVAALQESIAEGLDLSTLEATAAGEENQNNADGLHSASDFNRSGTEGQVDTRTLNFDRNGGELDDRFDGVDPLGIQLNASIALNPIAGDNIINLVESQGSVPVTGVVGEDAQPGDTIQVTVNGNVYTGTVQDDLTFTVDVPGSDLAADPNIVATVTDSAGVSYTASTVAEPEVDLVTNATISVDPITDDDLINAAESSADISVGGTVGEDASPGDTVTLEVNGNQYTGIVSDDNTFSILVTGSDLAADNNIVASVTGSDPSQNVFSVSITSDHLVDTEASGTISINPVTADNVINAAESGSTINVSGSVGGDASVGDTVTLTINGNEYTGVVAEGNVFDIPVSGADLAADSQISASVSGTDNVDNPFTATLNQDHGVDLIAEATVIVDPITADDILNAAEQAGNVTLTGSVSGDARPGDPISFTVNGTQYSTVVADDLTFSAVVAGSDLGQQTSFDVTVTGEDDAGNPFTATTTSTHTVDGSASATISVNGITADDVVNALEAAGTVAVTGSVGGDAQAGDTVSFTVNGTDYSGVVAADLSFSVDVTGTDLAADTEFEVSVAGTDSSGNPYAAATTSTHTVDTSAAGTISVDPITPDGVVNAAEAAGTINVTGTVGGDAAPGDTVSFTVNGTDYSGVVEDGGVFSIPVAGSDLALDTSFELTVVGEDDAGNPFTGTTTSTHSVDMSSSASISINAIAGDDVINAVESASDLVVTGLVSGDAEAGDSVVINVGGTDYSGTVNPDGSSYAVTIPTAAVAILTAGNVTATLSGTDAGGNPFTASNTRPFTVDTDSSATITVDSITADDIVNAAEAAATVAVTGTVGGDAAEGDTVSFTINGTDYSGLVAADLSFSIDVAGSDLAADTSFDATVTGSDTAGNPFTATTTSTHTVDTVAAATITVDSITADDIINAAEAAGTVAVTGSVGGDAAEGDTVSFTINGTDYSGLVAADLSYSIDVAGSDLAADTSFDATVTGSDTAGNPFTATTTSTHTVDTVAAATITVDSITADDIINAAEAAGTVAVTGSVGGDAAEGDTVSFTINGTDYSGTVAADLSFSIDVAGSDLAADTSFDATVTGSDTAGNPFTATTTSTHTVDTVAAATITVDSITADDIINAAEAASTVAVTGTVGGDAAEGDTVSFTINGTDYSGLVAADLSYSIDVAGSDLAADTSFDATVTGSDAAGNPFTATTTSTHTVDTVAAATITVDSITADDIVNAAEAASTVAVTGSVGGDAAEGDAVSFTINGTDYSGLVAADLSYSIDVAGSDLAADTSFDATVAGSDTAGNPFTATATSTHTVDTVAAATITVDSITADDIINAAEAAGTVAVTGSVGGDAAEGDTVSFTINGTDYSGLVAADLSFSIDVAGSDLAADTSFDATVAGSDTAGNPFTATTTSTHTVDTVAAATITVDSITADDIINAAEAAGTVAVTGSVGGDAAEGDTVSFTINGTDYSGLVAADLSYSIDVAGSDLAADTSFDATVAGSDTAGNPFTATTTSTHTVDTVAAATITVDSITADDIINAAEAAGTVAVTGTVGGDAAEGDTVSFTINGTDYSGLVAADLSFSIDVAGSDLAADTSFDATVAGSDTAGNPFTATTTSTHTVDTVAAATITVDSITADDIINAAEAAGTVAVTGSVGGDAAEGDTVSFTINGTDYSGLVAADLSYSIDVAGSDLAADTSFDATVTGSDTAGNPFTATTTSTHTVDTVAAATITVDSITADDIINAAEAAGTVAVTGSVGGDAAEGDTVSFTINGADYSGTVAADLSYSIDVSGADLAADTSFDATVTGSDAAGNPFTATTTSTHTVDTVAAATITVDSITADDIINAAEAAGTVAVTGTVGGDAAEGDTVSFTVNGTDYSGTVAADLSYSIDVAGSDLAADTSFDATVAGSDTAGNPFSATTTSTHTVDTVAAATITVDSITADDIINAAEAAGTVAVTGSVGGDAAEGDTVSFTINGTDYSGLVAADLSYSIDVAGSDLAADTSFDATVTGSDAAGNPFTATTTSTHTVDTVAAATITVDSITADDIVNAAEAASTVAVTGSVGGDAAEGDTVSFTINGTDYSGLVAADLTYSIDVAGSDLAADTSFDATVTGSDAAGNPFSATTTSTHTVDTVVAATITVDSITADDIINAAEAAGTVAVTGTVGGDAAEGDTVSFTVNGTDYSGTVAADLSYSIDVAGSDLAADTSFDATVAGSDAAGNPFTATTTSTHTVDTVAAATITVDSITADDIINAAEAAGTVAVTGSVGGDAAEGDTVSFTINGTDYSGLVAADLSYSIDVAGSDLAADTSFDATVTGSDAAGNPFTATTTSTHTVDTVAAATITVDSITADDIINAAEAAGTVSVTGSVGGDAAEGDTVSFTVNGTDYSGTVAADLSFSIDVAGSDLAADTSFDATVTGSDTAGNPFTATTTSTHTVDTVAAATITVDSITADDIINAAEAASTVAVTGSVGGDAAEGDTVSFTINGTDYSGTVAADLSFSIDVAGSDLAADTSFDATVAGSDTAGNPFTATTTSTHTVDTVAAATITVDSITADDIINAAEAAGTVAVTGTVGGDAAEGDTVSFTINGTDYSGLVAVDLSFSIDVAGSDLAADTSFDATVAGSDTAGNPFTATTTSTHTVDTVAAATITVDSITADDIINAAEAAATVAVTGTVGGDAAEGDTVSFTINGTDYSGLVAADLSFSIDVAGSDLAADTSFDATVAGSDTAGNPFSATTTSTHGLSLQPPALDLDADNSSFAIGSDYSTFFDEGTGSAVAIADTDVAIADVDDTNIESATITLTNVESGDLLTVSTLPTGISASAFNGTTGVLTLTGSATLADYQTAIRAVQFENDGSGSDTTRVIEVTVNDGENDSNVATSSIDIFTVPTVSISNELVQEPDSGTATLTFTISLDQPLSSDLSFDYDTADITAVGGADYDSITSSGSGGTQAVIVAGDTSVTLTVTVNSDTDFSEGDETFGLDLSGFSQPVNFEAGANIVAPGVVRGIGTIGVDDGAPVATDDTYFTPVDTVLTTGDTLLNDTLVDGAAISGFTQPSNGSVTDNGDGTFTYTPDSGFSGVDTFTYTITDLDGDSDTASVAIAVGVAPPALPIVSNVPDSVFVEDASPQAILSGTSITDSDSSTLSSVVVRIDGFIPSQDSLAFVTSGTSISGVTSVAGSTWELTLTGGADINEYLTVLNSITYENSSDNPSVAARSITVEAYDETFSNLFGTDSGSIGVTPVNDAPIAADTDLFFVDGSSDNFLALTRPTDPDTDDSALVITVTGIPTGVGTLTLFDGTPVSVGDTLTMDEFGDLLFDAGAVPGSDTFTYDVFDGELTTSATTTIGVGSTTADTGTVQESALPDGSGGGTTTATGNVLDNDPAAGGVFAIDSVEGITPTDGTVVITTLIGTLTVYTDDFTPGFSVGDYVYELTSRDTNDVVDIDEVFSYSFTSGGTAFSNDLTITVVDDVPMANPVMESVPESEELEFNLVFTLDTSGSMNFGLTEDSAPASGEPSRLDVATEALAELGATYFNQSSRVTITLVTFESSASTVGSFTDLSAFETALAGVTASGGTDFVSALDQVQTELSADIAGQLPADNVQNYSYFITDGESFTSPIGGGFDTFVADNGVRSYAVGIGSNAFSGFDDLNFIQNIDSLERGGGVSDGPLIVEDITQLEAELINTVPTAFGGNITLNGAIENIVFGADGGFIQSITIDIDSTTYVISYDGSTLSSSPALTGAEFEGSRLTLSSDVSGFTLGTFSLDFADGSYTFSTPDGNAGEQLTFDYTVIDGDGDTDSNTAIFDIVDSGPVARDDIDTVDPLQDAKGNVINAIGTDGGAAFGESLIPFAPQGSGVDTIVDDADVTQVNYRGLTFDLDFDSGSVPASGSAGTISWVYDTTTDNFGNEIARVTIDDSSDNARLIFNERGFYDFIPDATSVVGYVFVDTTSEAEVTASDFDITIAAGGTDLEYGSQGVGIDGGGSDSLNPGEVITLTFDSALLPNGVRDLGLTFGDFQPGEQVTITITHDTDEDNVFTTDTLVFDREPGSGTLVDLSLYSRITSADIAYSGASGDAALQRVGYIPEIAVSAVTPEFIQYTLTDSDGQSDVGQLSIYQTDGQIDGTTGADSISGTINNDVIVGDAGDDSLSGGAGNDILSGGEGDDSLLGEAGMDYLVGGAGDDSLLGGADSDYLSGGEGADILDGGTEGDTLLGGEGDDELYGGSGDDLLEGEAGDDNLYGGSGDDSLLGGEGNDLLVGGTGDDTATGGDGSDSFYWSSADLASGTTASDVITDFATGAGGDVLHLADLLQGEESNPLTEYLNFQSDGNGGTLINIDSSGGGTFETDQQITLEGVDLTAGGTLSNQQIIDSLLSDGNLVVD